MLTMFLTELWGRGVYNMASHTHTHTHTHTSKEHTPPRCHRFSLSGENGMMVLFQSSALIQPLLSTLSSPSKHICSLPTWKMTPPWHPRSLMRDAEEPPKPESSQRFVLSSVDEPASTLPPQVRLLALTRSLSLTHTHTHAWTNSTSTKLSPWSLPTKPISAEVSVSQCIRYLKNKTPVSTPVKVEGENLRRKLCAEQCGWNWFLFTSNWVKHLEDLGTLWGGQCGFHH